MTTITLERAGVVLCGTDTAANTGKGASRPVVFQHGLGGSEAQVAELFPHGAGLRRLTLACRGHDGSALGPPEQLSIATFADDVLAFAEQRGVRRYVAGGVSMGAAIALRLAVRHPDRVTGLILVRPAWVFDAAPPNMAPFLEVAALLRDHPPAAARARFESTGTAERLRREAPDNFASLLGFFDRRPVADTVALLSRLAADGPGVSASEAAAITVPVLVIGNDRDTIHPLATAGWLAGAIPGVAVTEVMPKANDRGRHADQVRLAIQAFCNDPRIEP